MFGLGCHGAMKGDDVTGSKKLIKVIHITHALNTFQFRRRIFIEAQHFTTKPSYNIY
jgi:hypothetical protein